MSSATSSPAATARTTWAGTLTAVSSIAHGGQSMGTITLLRREAILTPEGTLLHVPLVSGNALRGRLRRIGEQLLRETLRYEGQIPLAAAHALRGGGALAKVSGEPLSGARLATVRALVPVIAVFGAAAGGRVIDGALSVGRLMPHLAQTEHVTGNPGPDAFTATQLETYTRLGEATTTGFAAATTTPLDQNGRVDLPALTAETGDLTSVGAAGGGDGAKGGGPMLFRVETFPAGTRFASWIRLEHPTPVMAAFTADVLAEFAAAGTLGGRGGVGHGQVRAHWTRTDHPAAPPAVDWRAQLASRREEALAAIAALT